MGFFNRLKQLIVGKPLALNEKYSDGLQRSKRNLKERFNALLARYRKVDDAFFTELEDLLIQSDVGAKITDEILENVKAEVRLKNLTDPTSIVELTMENLYHFYTKDTLSSSKDEYIHRPHVILVVGVNGVGKTTSIAKLASLYQKQNKRVLLVAGDTFRAGAVEQLGEWAKRLQTKLIKGQENSDPSSVIFEGIKTGIRDDYDVILCDTAGRLHTKTNLMNELSKIKRVIEKQIGRGPDEVLLVLDATMGQNGVFQAKAFVEATQVTGIVLTKMDGTSKGGIILAIKDQLNVDVKYMGVGEKLDDLVSFDISSYLYSLFQDLLG